MRSKVILNGSLIDANEAVVPACSAGLLTGRGNFTTITLRNGRPHLWEHHERRLTRDAGALGIDLSSAAIGKLAEDVERLAEENGLEDGKARITILDGGAPSRWPAGITESTITLIQTAESPVMGALHKVGTSPFCVNESSPLAGIKSCNYEDPVLAYEEASRRGLDEAVRTDTKGRVSCGCLSNLFWISADSGRVRTPALTTGCIRGTTREYIVSRVDVEEVEFDINLFLADAKAVFFTSAVRWISPVSYFEDLGELEELSGPIAELCSGT